VIGHRDALPFRTPSADHSVAASACRTARGARIGIAIGRGVRFGGEGWLAYLATVSTVLAGIVLMACAALIFVRRRRSF
jgi:hypothetical protein